MTSEASLRGLTGELARYSRRSADKHCLDVHKLLNAIGGELTAIAALFDAAKRQAWIRFHERIDKTTASLQFVGGNVLTFGHILREHCRAQAAAGNLKKVSLELGGKSPNIVFSDSNLDTTIPSAASTIFFNHGQCCCAGSRLYVQKDVFADVAAGVVEEAKKIRMGPGFDPSATMGPLVSREQLERVCGYTDAGFGEGAKALVGGRRHGDRGYFFEPTVLVDTQPTMQVVQEEIFGPVVTAIPFEDLDDLIRVANDTVYGLAAGVWTRDFSKAHRMAEALRAGTVWINCYNVFDAALPFGGYKQSGWGREMGHHVLELYTEVKSVVVGL